jgi:hypothetical protein
VSCHCLANNLQFDIEDVETNQRNRFIAKLIRLAKGLVSITSNVFEQPELGQAEKEGMMSKLEKVSVQAVLLRHSY